MWNVVTGLMMLAGAIVRDKGQQFDDFGWRREVQQAREAQGADVLTSGSTGEGPGIFVTMTGAPQASAAEESTPMEESAPMSVAPETGDEVDGSWNVACEREAGDRLVFDRDSLREMGGVTLFRWAPTGGAVPSGDDPIYTAVADCRGKTIEATWPGKQSETRAGTCGRHLVDAVCAARSAGKTPRPEPDRLGRPRLGSAHAHASATP